MFKFDFAIEDIDEDIQASIPETSASLFQEQAAHPQAPFQEHTITQFLDALPSLISYSPLTVPVKSVAQRITLLHRDLFDARFQLISEGREDPDEVAKADSIEDDTQKRQGHTSVLSYLDTPSDLLPGVYEGGLKTWECSLDVVEYLATATPFSSYQGKRVLEVGCGTAVPSLYVLQKLFSDAEDQSKEFTEIQLQDYNESVLELMTIPNILLTWYLSPASQGYREPSESEALDVSAPGELPITDELKEAFLSSLKNRNISIRLFSGSWETFDLEHSGGNYDLLITSETIYRTESLIPLTRILDEGCGDPLSRKTARLTVEDQETTSDRDASPLCLVAAKILYFGVGGGISEFEEFVFEKKPGRKGQIETVLEKLSGVGRRVLRLQWI